MCFRVNPKSTLFQRWICSMNQRWQIDAESTWISRRDVISTYINVESTLSVCWVRLWAYNIKLAYIVSAVFIVKLKHKAHLFLVFLELTLSLYLFAVYLIISRIDFRIIETKNISKKYHLVSYMILVKRPC